jgi:hypothetical protein
MKNMMDLEADRQKSTAEQELTLSEVEPIKTDFYWFVLSVRDSLRVQAERDVQASRASSSKNSKNNDVYLINSRLNAYLMKAWEDLSPAQRDNFTKKEEEDRLRFMQEDEVASRHCATLTSRNKSPAVSAFPSSAASAASTTLPSQDLNGNGAAVVQHEGENEAKEDIDAIDDSAAVSLLDAKFKREAPTDDDTSSTDNVSPTKKNRNSETEAAKEGG